MALASSSHRHPRSSRLLPLAGIDLHGRHVPSLGASLVILAVIGLFVVGLLVAGPLAALLSR